MTTTFRRRAKVPFSRLLIEQARGAQEATSKPTRSGAAPKSGFRTEAPTVATRRIKRVSSADLAKRARKKTTTRRRAK